MFFSHFVITRGNFSHWSCVTKSVLLLPECVPSLNCSQIIVMVRRLYVANVLLLYIYVGDYLLSLDHFVLVRSDILTSEVAMGIRGNHAMITCFGMA